MKNKSLKINDLKSFKKVLNKDFNKIKDFKTFSHLK